MPELIWHRQQWLLYNPLTGFETKIAANNLSQSTRYKADTMIFVLWILMPLTLSCVLLNEKEAKISFLLPLCPNFTSLLCRRSATRSQGVNYPRTLFRWRNQHKSRRVKQTNLQEKWERGWVRVRQFIYFYILQCFFSFSFHWPFLCSSLTNTPCPGKLPLLLPSPACHMWFQSANLALCLQGSFRQVSL